METNLTSRGVVLERKGAGGYRGELKEMRELIELLIEGFEFFFNKLFFFI